MRPLRMGVGFVLATCGALATAQERFYFKGIEYGFTRVERTPVYPADLVSEGQEAPKPPAKDEEFAIVRFKVIVTDSVENSSVSDAKLVGRGGVYPCRVKRVWCLSDGCQAAFVSYVPQSVFLERFELGEVAISLPEVPEDRE